MTTEIVPAKEIRPAQPLQQDRIFNAKPKAMVAAATEYANELRNVIEKQKLFTMMQGKKHVNIEGWTTLGTMMGILPREVEVKEHDDGSFEARVELYNMHTGAIVGGGSALCGMDEKRWGNAPRYARRSMAVTRATGKAYRSGFGWVMALAGYQVTPSEEMPQQSSGSKNQDIPFGNAVETIYTGTKAQIAVITQHIKSSGIPEDKWKEARQAVNDLYMNKPYTDETTKALVGDALIEYGAKS